jgi:hypothetical protein
MSPETVVKILVGILLFAFFFLGFATFKVEECREKALLKSTTAVQYDSDVTNGFRCKFRTVGLWVVE